MFIETCAGLTINSDRIIDLYINKGDAGDAQLYATVDYVDYAKSVLIAKGHRASIEGRKTELMRTGGSAL